MSASPKIDTLPLAHSHFSADSQLYPSLWNVLFQATWSVLPEPLLYYIRYMPSREYKRYRSTLKVMDKVSQQLIEERRRDFTAGDPDASRKDVMSVLGKLRSLYYATCVLSSVAPVRANTSENPRTRLNDEEMRSQMATMTLAGHETTANTLTWLLWELAKHPEVQDALRAEIAEKREGVTAAGAYDFTMEDLESMPLLQAVIKVGPVASWTCGHKCFHYARKHSGSTLSLPSSGALRPRTTSFRSRNPS